MKILFIARHFTYYRNFESVIVEYASRGHQVHLTADVEETFGGRELVDRLANRFPNRITVGFTPIARADRYRGVAAALRVGLDYLRYTDPRYEATPKIRERAWKRTPAFVVALARMPFRRVMTRLLEATERAVPPQQGIHEFFDEHKPDLLLVTPLIELGSPQIEYVREARRRGVPSALCVWSWDHLSSKALVRVPPDALFVWNETQRLEAGRFHGIATERVIVTGAQCFDQWFGRRPLERAEFCRRVGLRPDRPFLLWVCSALFKGSPLESAFVREWVRAIRSSSEPRLRGIGLLVRPHPQRLEEWQTPWEGMENVAVWGSNPVDEQSRNDYFDSMFHSEGVVGLNTSALVEAAIVDRPVFTILPPEFRDNQEGTFHFHYLLTVGGGFLHRTRSLDEHVSQVAAVLEGGATHRNREFVEQFIRPRGLDVPATPAFVDASESLVRDARPAESTAEWAIILRPAVIALAAMERLPWLERLYWTPIRWRKWADAHEIFRRKAARRREKLQDKRRRVARKTREQVVVRAKTVAKQALTGATKHSS
jgi:hypothetical protein